MLEHENIPRTMATQHPDNARVPNWSKEDTLKGDDEIYEAFYCYKELNCQEVMWDSEGKDVDTRVVRKLLSYYSDYFHEHILGRDVFLTYRIPNPRLDLAERKIIIETLENITVSHDVASTFYDFDVAPIFEVILPMTTEPAELLRLSEYYLKVVSGIDKIKLGELSIEDWLGPLNPKKINVIPLVEDTHSILTVDNIIQPYINHVKPKYMRVFIARSDPALYDGMTSAILLSKVALSKLKSLENKMGIPIYPILGTGSLPFRGHLTLDNIQNFLNEYKGVYTTTIQSALRYDYSFKGAKILTQTLNNELPRGDPVFINQEDERNIINLILKLKNSYRGIIEPLSALINDIVSFIPQRRMRKPHLGLFGYSRRMSKSQLPRAIPFTCTLYTLGFPPEFLDLEILNELTDEEWTLLKKFYLNMERDLRYSASMVSLRSIDLLNENNKKIAKKIKTSKEQLRQSIDHIKKCMDAVEERLDIKFGPRNLTQRKYENIICNFVISYINGDKDSQKHMIEAAMIRKCLG